MSLLFVEPLIEGLRYQDDLISEAEERALLDRLGQLELAPFRFHGWLGNRKTHGFGWRYDFGDASFTPGDQRRIEQVIRHCERSEAIQTAQLDCFVAFAPRNNELIRTAP